MSTSLEIVIGVSLIVAVIFILAMRSVLRDNKAIDAKIDYSKVHALQDDEDD